MHVMMMNIFYVHLYLIPKEKKPKRERWGPRLGCGETQIDFKVKYHLLRATEPIRRKSSDGAKVQMTPFPKESHLKSSRSHSNARSHPRSNAPSATVFWYKVGVVSVALGKSPLSTTWLFDAHCGAHDFTLGALGTKRSKRRFASNLWHTGTVLVWLFGMYFHGTYFSNLWQWYKDPIVIVPTCTQTHIMIGQQVVNSTTIGDYSLGVHMTTGFMHLWCTFSFVHTSALFALCTLLTTFGLAFILGAYLSIHVHLTLRKVSTTTIQNYLSTLGLDTLYISGHNAHIAPPLIVLLDIGVLSYCVPNVVVFPNPLTLVWIFVRTGWSCCVFCAHKDGIFSLCTTFSFCQITVHHVAVGCFALLPTSQTSLTT